MKKCDGKQYRKPLEIKDENVFADLVLPFYFLFKFTCYDTGLDFCQKLPY